MFYFLMSLYEDIDKLLCKLEVEKSISLLKPKGRPTASFRSTIYNVLKNRGLKAKVTATQKDNDLIFVVSTLTEESLLFADAKKLELRIMQCTCETIAASLVFIGVGAITGVEFIGCEPGEIEKLSAEAGLNLEEFQIVDTGVSCKLTIK